MNEEIDIISLIKSRRYIFAALQELIPAERVRELKKKSAFVMVDPDVDDSDSGTGSTIKQNVIEPICDQIIIEKHIEHAYS